jgi:hypothetical protein
MAPEDTLTDAIFPLTMPYNLLATTKKSLKRIFATSRVVPVERLISYVSVNIPHAKIRVASLGSHANVSNGIGTKMESFSRKRNSAES